MNKQQLIRGFAIPTVSLLGLLLSNSIVSADPGNGKRANEVGSMGPVPKAVCGPSDRTESGLQGQTTTAERAVVNGVPPNAATTAISSSSANSEERGHFRRMGRRTLITAPTWQRKITLCRSTPVSL